MGVTTFGPVADALATFVAKSLHTVPSSVFTPATMHIMSACVLRYPNDLDVERSLLHLGRTCASSPFALMHITSADDPIRVAILERLAMHLSHLHILKILRVRGENAAISRDGAREIPTCLKRFTSLFLLELDNPENLVQHDRGNSDITDDCKTILSWRASCKSLAEIALGTSTSSLLALCSHTLFPPSHIFETGLRAPLPRLFRSQNRGHNADTDDWDSEASKQRPDYARKDLVTTEHYVCGAENLQMLSCMGSIPVRSMGLKVNSVFWFSAAVSRRIDDQSTKDDLA
ncbi:hypothetical protein C8R45DRAFT_1094602 [Mycena sanguinolenta]|nr:hypothetical protein C8R45DRAFT_1094602 [Mycena sanguinolenta]